MSDDAVTLPTRSGGRLVLLISVALAALVIGGYAAAYFAAKDRLPLGTTVAGVDVGGDTKTEALARLESTLNPRLDRSVTVDVAGQTSPLTADAVGFTVSWAQTLDQVETSSSASPSHVLGYFLGGEDLDPVVAYDAASLTAALAGAADGVITPPVEGAVFFADGQVEVIDPIVGQGVDHDHAMSVLTTAFLAESTEVTELSVVPLEPDIDAGDVSVALTNFAERAVSGPITLRFGESPLRLRPEVFSAALRMDAVDGVLVPAYRPGILKKIVDARIAPPDAPVDAEVRLVNGKPRVIQAKPGVTYDAESTTQALAIAVVGDGEARTADVTGLVTEPDFTTADAQALKITEKVSSFTTYYPYAAYRNINIGRAAELIDGTVLKPGDAFSLNDIVGERTRENGFTEGFIISNGVFKEDLGGGVSQMATTTFNAAFFAGLKDLEHKPHSFYIDRYPAGREATVAWGAVDLRFQNDTPYGVLIHAYVIPGSTVRQGTVVVEMWSTKYWNITTSSSPRYNLTSPQTRTFDTEDCVPNIGYGGFDIDVYRYFRKPGSSELVRTEKFFTRYTPADTVICEPPPDSQP